MAADQCRPVFLIGMERSGTSLLRAVLHNHPHIGIPARGELQFYAKWNRHYGNLADSTTLKRFHDTFFEKSKVTFLDVDKADVFRRVRDYGPTYAAYFQSVMEAYAAKEGKPRWGEKSTTYIFHLPELLRDFPDAQYILIVRDPRDTYLSVANVEWHAGEAIDPVGWTKKWQRTYWHAAKTLLHHTAPFLLYRHEDFVTDSEKQVHRVLNYLDEPFKSNLLQFDGVDWRQNSSFKQARDPIDPSTVGRWREKLSTEEIELIETAAQPAMNLFGYEASTASTRTPRARPRFRALLRRFTN